MTNKSIANSLISVEIMLQKTTNDIIDQLNRVNSELNTLRRMIADTNLHDGTATEREKHNSEEALGTCECTNCSERRNSARSSRTTV